MERPRSVSAICGATRIRPRSTPATKCPGQHTPAKLSPRLSRCGAETRMGPGLCLMPTWCRQVGIAKESRFHPSSGKFSRGSFPKSRISSFIGSELTGFTEPGRDLHGQPPGSGRTTCDQTLGLLLCRATQTHSCIPQEFHENREGVSPPVYALIPWLAIAGNFGKGGGLKRDCGKNEAPGSPGSIFSGGVFGQGRILSIRPAPLGASDTPTTGESSPAWVIASDHRTGTRRRDFSAAVALGLGQASCI